MPAGAGRGHPGAEPHHPGPPLPQRAGFRAGKGEVGCCCSGKPAAMLPPVSLAQDLGLHKRPCQVYGRASVVIDLHDRCGHAISHVPLHVICVCTGNYAKSVKGLKLVLPVQPQGAMTWVMHVARLPSRCCYLVHIYPHRAAPLANICSPLQSCCSVPWWLAGMHWTPYPPPPNSPSLDPSSKYPPLQGC